MNAYQSLLNRLDAFIRKYYRNQIYRGVLVLLIVLITTLLILSISEYYLYLAAWIKIVCVSILVLGTIAALLFWILLPTIHLFKIGKTLSYTEAASIIRTHFTEVKDQLINILQLKEQSAQHSTQQALIEASIIQKTENIALIPLSQAIDLSKNKKYLPYLLPLMGIAIFIGLAAPNVFKEAGTRLLAPTQNFERPAPFEFVALHKNLEVVQNEDFLFQVQLKGNELPAQMELLIADETIPMQALKEHKFQYFIKNCKEDINIVCQAAGYRSKPFTLKAIQQPGLKNIQLSLNYPSYTGKATEVIKSLTNLTLPQGTLIHWDMVPIHSEQLSFQLGSAAAIKLKDQEGHYYYQQQFLQDSTWAILLKNERYHKEQAYQYKIQVIPDQAPQLQVKIFKDSIDGTQLVFNGIAGDDYGISKILFHYQIKNEKGQLTKQKALPISYKGKLTAVAFQHYFDIGSIALAPGEQLNYFIEAWDNDALHGSKATRSAMMEYRSNTLEQLDTVMQKNVQQVNQNLEKGAEQNQKLQENIEKLQSQWLQNENSNWQQNQQIQHLQQYQEQIKNQLEQSKKRLAEQQKQSEQKNLSEAVQEKQEALQKHLDQMLNKDLAKQMQKLQELLQQKDKKNALSQLQELEEENKMFSMDLERLQALMKKLELQIKLESSAKKLEQLAKDQKDLSKNTQNKSSNNTELNTQQKALEKQLQDVLQKDLKELQKQAEEAKQNSDFNKEEKAGQKAAEQMQQSSEQLQENNNSKAAQQQDNAAQNLQDMAASLQQKSGSMDMQQLEMNIKTIRQVLTNLMRQSFDQEKLMQSSQKTSSKNPAYIKNMEQQAQLHQNSLVIRDSLYSLSKKLFKLSATITKESNQLEKNMRYAQAALEKRAIAEAAKSQQYVMTHTNNLALLLQEMLANLIQEQNQGQQKSGKAGQCNNPGGKTPKPGAGQQLKDIISKQQDLNGKIQKGKQGEQKQGTQGQKPKQGQGQGSASEQNGGNDQNAKMLMQLAQQQAAIRRQMAQLNQMLNSQGNNSIAKELKNLQEQMDKNETDLVNKKLDADFYKRQQEILTRMLETESSLREQEQDEKRSSKSATEISRPIPSELKPYLIENQFYKEQYQMQVPGLKPYYKELNQQYLQKIQ